MNPGDWLKVVCQVGRSKSTDALQVYSDGKLEGYAQRHTKPVQAAKLWSTTPQTPLAVQDRSVIFVFKQFEYIYTKTKQTFELRLLFGRTQVRINTNYWKQTDRNILILQSGTSVDDISEFAVVFNKKLRTPVCARLRSWGVKQQCLKWLAINNGVRCILHSSQVDQCWRYVDVQNNFLFSKQRLV